MIQYFFSFIPENRLVEIKILIPKVQEKKLNLHLPAWRPGRYQLQNFAKNVLNFTAKNQGGELLQWKKTKKNIWTVADTFEKDIEVTYHYFANELNAGSCFINQNFIYINPVNLCLYLPKDINKRFEVIINNQNADDQIACGIKHLNEPNTFKLQPDDFHHFFDSPFIISKDIFHEKFEVGDSIFNIWIEGNFKIDSQKLVEDLKKNSRVANPNFRRIP